MVILGAFLLFGLIMALVRCYRRCPSNKVLAVWGTGTGQKAALAIHGGGKFIIPVAQDYAYLSLEPIQIEVPLKGRALGREHSCQRTERPSPLPSAPSRR